MKKYSACIVGMALIASHCGFAIEAKDKYSGLRSNSSYFGRLRSSLYHSVNKAIIPFQAGYFSTEEEKAAAQKIIDELEIAKKKILLLMSSSPSSPILQKKLKEIDDEIHKQKIITGQAWSKHRKIVVSLLALSGAVLSFCAYNYFYPVLSYLDMIKLRQKELDEINKTEWIKNERGSFIKNPQFNELAAIAAEEKLDQALMATPFDVPDLVSLDDIEALKKRRDCIAKQQYVLEYKNPNFDSAMYKIADQQYKDALKDPSNIVKLEEKFKKRMKEDPSFRNAWRTDRWSIEKHFMDIADDVRRNTTPYKAPALVDEHDLEALKQRLETIRLKRWMYIDSSKYSLLNHYGAIQAREDYKKAFAQYGQEYASRVSYSSPDLVDFCDTEALWERRRAIEKQKLIEIYDEWLGWQDVRNPNFNKADHKAAVKAYTIAALRKRSKGTEWRDEQWTEYWRVVHNLKPKDLFKVAYHIGSYSESAHYVSILEDASRAFKKLDESTQLQLLAKMKPYYAPPSVDSDNLLALYNRYQEIERQKSIEYDGMVYPNVSFSESDLEDAWWNYLNAHQREQERLENQGWFAWGYETLFGK